MRFQRRLLFLQSLLQLKMKKELLIPAFFILLISCTFIPSKTVAIEKGTKALEINFIKDSPPYQVYENTNALVSIDIKNAGAQRIKNGVYSLIFPDQYVDVVEPSGSFNLLGKQEGLPYGEETQINFPVKIKSLASQQQILPVDFIFSACFQYRTKSGFSICIDTDQLNTDKSKPCTVKPLSTSGGQGSPLVITKIEPRMELSKEYLTTPVFDIYVQNYDKGIVSSANDFAKFCTSKPVSKSIVEADVKLGDEKLECNKPEFEIKSSEVKFTCKSKELSRSEGIFNALLVVDLSYGYAQTIAKQVKILKQ